MKTAVLYLRVSTMSQVKTDYDAEGRVTKVTDAEGGVTEDRYNAAGQRIASIDTLGRTTHYRYDDRGKLVETIFPGSEHEMITVIHPDGDDLALTHYCMLGNQPQMKAAGKGEGNKVEFKTGPAEDKR